MALSFLEITSFRNIAHISIEPISHINIFCGENGSGKTSLLEAIYHLSLGRSFRARFSHHAIQYGQSKLTVFGRIFGKPVGIERSLDGKSRIHVSEKEIQSVSELAKILPLQLINPDTYLLITSGPKYRREFIDWGVFHVEHEFLSLWKQAQRILKQRNAALKLPESQALEQVGLWDGNFASVSEKINVFRKEYIEKLRPILSEIVMKLLELEKLDIQLKSGWDTEKSLVKWLKNSHRRDLFLGYTQYGPHRADLTIMIDEKPAQEILSRGQMKLMVCAMRLAQAVLLKQATDKNCVFLIDDLPSELDRPHRKVLCDVISGLETQVFVTGIESGVFSELFDPAKTRMFHVEHGKVEEFDKTTISA